MYIARHQCQTMIIKDEDRPLASYLELSRNFDKSGSEDIRFLSDNWQRMLLRLQRKQRSNGGNSNIVNLYRTTAKEIQEEKTKSSVKLTPRQLIYQTVAKIQSSLAGDRLVTEAEDTIGTSATSNRVNFAYGKEKLQPVNARMVSEWNRKNNRRNSIKASSGALNDTDEGEDGEYDPQEKEQCNSLYFHLAKLSFEDPEQYKEEYGEKVITGEDARCLMGHAASIARKYETEQREEAKHKAQFEQNSKLQAEKQRISILEQAKSEATKLVAEVRTAIQNDLLVHQATASQLDHIPNPSYEQVEPNQIHSQSGSAGYLQYPSYPHVGTNGHFNYVDPAFPPASIFNQPPLFTQAGSLYKQQAYTNMQRGRPPNPAGQSMPKGYPPPPNPPNSGPPTPVDHCNICGMHKTECEGIGSRYVDPHTNISHCYLRDKMAGSFNLDFRALDPLKLATLTREKRERVIAASNKNGVLYGLPPQYLAEYRERFRVPDPAPTPPTNTASNA